MRAGIAGLKMLAFALLCLVIVPLQLLVLLFTRGSCAYIIPHFWHKSVCLIFGIKVKWRGEVSKNAQTLFVSNHISYLDIPAIASVLREASFVAKKDVASWPVFGFLSKLQQTAFISRSRGEANNVAGSLDSMLEEGKNLVIFAEGTSTDGSEVLPFKSSLFSLVMTDSAKDMMIQPMSIKVLQSNGKKPVSQEDRDIYSWHRNMDTELPAHLWGFAKSGGAVLEIVFHPVLAANAYEDRKTLAKACHIAVSKELNNSKE